MEQLPEGFVLDEDTEAQSSALPEGFVLDSDDPMEGQGIFEKGAKALQYGAAQRAVGYGKTLDAVGADEAGRTLVELGQAIAPDDYRSASADFFNPQEKDAGPLGFGWGYAPRALLEQVPGLAADLGVGALTGGTGFVISNAGGNFGPMLEARTQNDGRTMDEATFTDYAAAGAGTALNAYLNKVGVNPALNATVKGAGVKALAQVPGVVGKAALAEGVTEAGQTAVDQAATQIGTERGWDPLSKESIREVAGAGFLGAAAGGAIRAGRIPGDVSNSIRDMSYDPESATRVADYVKTVDEKLGTEKGEYKALRTTKQHFESQFTQAKKGANEFIKEREAGSLVAEVDNRLKHGYTLRDTDYEQLESLFGDRADGIALINAVKDRDTVNRLTSRGTVTDGEQRFGGGLSGGKLGRFINPSRTVGRFIGTAAGGATAAGQLAIPFASQLALASPMVAKLYASQMGAYTGARAIDSVLGTSHPMKRFSDRWSGVAETNSPNLPTTKDLRAAQKALQKLQAEEERIYAQASKGGSGRSSPDPALKAAQVEKGLKKARAAEEAQEAAQEARRRQEEAAWAERTALPKNASEDALWAEYEAARAKEVAPLEKSVDSDAQAAIQQSLKAQDALAKTVADAQAKKVADYSVRVKPNKEAARAKRKLEEAKARQEKQKNRENLTNATSAFNHSVKELRQTGGIESLVSMKDEATTEPTKSSQRKKAHEALEKLKKVEEAASKPKPAEMPDVQPTKGSKKLSEKALEKLRQSVEVEGDEYVTRRGVQESRIPKDSIRTTPERWKASVQQHFEVREKFANAVGKLGGRGFKDEVNALLARMSNQAQSWEEAYSYFEDFVNEPKHERLANEIWDVFNEHMAALKGTYKHDKAPR